MEDPNNDSIPWKEQNEVSTMGYFLCIIGKFLGLFMMQKGATCQRSAPCGVENNAMHSVWARRLHFV